MNSNNPNKPVQKDQKPMQNPKPGSRVTYTPGKKA